ncbi:MAG TPA: hypothetical protein VK308_03555 [Pyrinomonadaceae bacterium]|nr:hypothetical protein [Pyrinomonadaceae bacterium]
MRSLLPNNAVAYLETDDLAKTLESLTGSPAFEELAVEKPDFLSLENMQIAVIVTGFQTSEENSVLNFKPQFVAVAETHAWSWQTVSFVENQLDSFVRKNYGADAALETREKDNGKFFGWTGSDGRKVFAFVKDSLIYFGNDAATIEKCPAVKKGETESLLKNEFLTRVYSENNLAFGYVSLEGIKQIAELAGVSAAVETTDESSGRSFIARVLRQVLRNTTNEIIWTANKNERGVEDKIFVSLKTEAASVFNETLAASTPPATNSFEFLPADFSSVTRYNLKNPLISWRSLLLVAAENTDLISRRFLIEFSGSLLEPYGISNAESFLNSIESEILTAQFDAENEKTVVIVGVKDPENTKKAIAAEINFKSEPETQFNARIWFSEDKQIAAAFVENKLILGATEYVLKCLQAKQNNQNFTKNRNFQKLSDSESVAVTFGKDFDTAEKIVSVLGKKKDENRKPATFYSTETRFTETGVERKTVSDFGFIGTILKQLKQ